MASDETLILAAAMMGNAVQRDLPNLSEQAKICAMVRGVALMLNAGAFARFGKLYMPGKSAPRHDIPRADLTLCSCGHEQ